MLNARINETILTAYFVNPFHQTLCLHVYHPNPTIQRLGETVTAAINTHQTIELLDASFPIGTCRIKEYRRLVSLRTSYCLVINTCLNSPIAPAIQEENRACYVIYVYYVYCSILHKFLPSLSKSPLFGYHPYEKSFCVREGRCSFGRCFTVLSGHLCARS